MITLVLGGTRSGKSALAEKIATTSSHQVTYVATGWATDAGMEERIALHQARRPEHWATVEVIASELADVLARLEGTVLVDALGTWVAAHPDFEVDVPPVVDALVRRAGDTIVVSDEVGLGVHPSTEIGQRFRDVLGLVNHAVAEVCDQVLLVVAGRVLPLERW
jgi:adenosyl cobinamide kinase/adenosyl cobinamide phosphate guanylyltransferase